MDVVVFCYNRPEKLQMCLNSINLSYVEKLWIFVDGPKRPEHSASVEETFNVASTFKFENKSVIIREHNYGTPLNVIAGLDQVFGNSDSCLILEDDCIVKPTAYSYVDWALKAYRYDKRVFSINTMAPLNGFLNLIATMFIKNDIVACNRVHSFWGWATWSDRWEEFRSNLEPFKNPYGNAQNVPLKCGQHIKKTLELYEEGKVGGWDARLLVLSMYAKRLHLHPKKSLMRNIGLDGTGIHHGMSQFSISSEKDLEFSDFLPLISDKDINIEENKSIKFLGLLYTIVIWVRSKFFARVSKELKLKVRKLIFGKKIKNAQF